MKPEKKQRGHAGALVVKSMTSAHTWQSFQVMLDSMHKGRTPPQHSPSTIVISSKQNSQAKCLEIMLGPPAPHPKRATLLAMFPTKRSLAGNAIAEADGWLTLGIIEKCSHNVISAKISIENGNHSRWRLHEPPHALRLLGQLFSAAIEW